MADPQPTFNDFSHSTWNPSIPLGVPIEAIPAIARTAYSTQWMMQRTLYFDWWRWFDGRALDAIDPTVKAGDPSIYPLHVNPVEMVCAKHAEALFGEVPDEADNMVGFSYRNDDNEEDDQCLEVADVVNRVWAENNGRQLMQQNGIISQFLGGNVFKVAYDPDPYVSDSRPTRVRLDSILPDYFLPVYDMTDPYNLLETFMMYYISPQEARLRYHVDVDERIPQSLYVEHWTRDQYELQVGGLAPTLQVGDAEWVTTDANPYGAVPFVYIPHARRTGGFYGTSHVPELIGLARELNVRLADIGDNVHDNSQPVYWVRNVAYTIKVRHPAEGMTILDLGGAGPSGREPMLERLDVPPSHTLAENFIKELWQMVERIGHVPGVAFGIDEGSQRSGATLNARMWPLVSHIRDERSHWTTGLRAVNKLIIKVLISRGELPEDATKLHCKVDWFPMLPRDRAEMVNEVTARKGVGMISRSHGLAMLDESDDTEAEKKDIEADLKLEASLQIKQNPPQKENVNV